MMQQLRDRTQQGREGELCIRAASWNIAAVNNNPFEYWITSNNPEYNALMLGVQNYIEGSGHDVRIFSIFTDEMFADLCDDMRMQGIGGLEELATVWKDDYRGRLAINGFLKDKSIGTKRLASMPDRITNTINLHDGSICRRPTAINAYDGPSLSTIESWWQQWRDFMFRTYVKVAAGDDPDGKPKQLICSLIGPILRSKYPAVSVQEQAISVPLQMLCLAVLDSIFVYILNAVSPGRWEFVRRELCDALITNKAARVLSILATSYKDHHVIFVQEAAAILVHDVRQHQELCQRYHLLVPWNLDGKRDQNSLIFVDRQRFRESSTVDVTQLVLNVLGGTWVAPGDLLVASIEDVYGQRWLLASFHGDSNGLSTQPVVRALDTISKTDFQDHILLMGIDANTYSATDDPFFHGVASFCEFIQQHHIISLWGPEPKIRTTCSSRTYLQPQLNKATPFQDRCKSDNQNLKDWILAYEHQTVQVGEVCRDNTGARTYVEDLVLPTLEFPSDHSIVSAVFHMMMQNAALPKEDTAARGAQALGYSDETTNSPSGTITPTSSAGESSQLRQRDRWKLKATFSSSRRSNNIETTLYDYWGLVKKPLASAGLGSGAASLPAHTFVQIDSQVGSALTVEEEISKLCEEHFLESVLNPAQHDLDWKHLMFSKSEDRSIWILFSPRAFSMALCKRWAQVLMLLSALTFLVVGVLNVVSMLSMSSYEAAHFRFTPLEMRKGPQAPISWPSVDSIGMLLDGCRLLESYNTTVTGTALTVSFRGPVRANGWYLVTASQPVEEDPVRFVLERSSDGVTWQEIQPPPWVLGEGFYSIPHERMKRKDVDLRPTLDWLLRWCTVQFWMALGCFVSLGWGVAGQGRRATQTCACAWLGSSILVLVVACCKDTGVMNGQQSISSGLWLTSFSYAFIAASVWQERYIIDSMPLGFLLNLPSLYYDRHFQNLSYSNNAMVWMGLLVPVLWTILPVVSGLSLRLARYFIGRWVFTKYVGNDRAAYDTAWRNVVMKDSEVGGLGRLRECSKRIQQVLPAGQIFQHHSRARSPEDVTMNGMATVATRWFGACQHLLRPRQDTRERVTSLDQLYAQASALDILLRDKIKQLAERSSGCLPTVSAVADDYQVHFRKWRDIMQDSQSLRVKFVALKPKDRILEKLLRSYDCEVARLLDCCRQSIVFDEVEQLVECLEAISRDEEIEIVRLKTRMDEGYDAETSAGFRNVVLNLRILSEKSRRLGIDAHVCELQLTLKCFAELMSDESHARYLVLRNCRDAPSLLTPIRAAACRILYSKLDSKVHCGGSSEHSASVSPADEIHPPLVLIDYTARQGASLPDQTKDIEVTCKDSHSEIRTNMVTERKRALEQHFVASITSRRRYGGKGFNKDLLLEEAVANATSGSVWDTSHPLAATLCKPWISLLIFGAVIFIIVNIWFIIKMIQSKNTSRAYHFRFSAVENRVSGFPTSPGISELGLLKDRCGDFLKDTAFLATSSNATFTISFGEPVEMNGWWFQTTGASIDHDPVRFYLESCDSATDCRSWRKIGASTLLWSWAGAPVLNSGIYHTTEARQHLEMQELTAPWIWAFCILSMSFNYLLVNFALLVAVLSKNQMYGTKIVAIACFINVVFAVVACIGFYLEGQGPLSFVAGVAAATNLGLSGIILLDESLFRHYCAVAGIAGLMALAVHYLMLQNPLGVLGSTLGFENGGLYQDLGLISLSLIAFLMRRHSRRLAQAVIRHDQEAYDKCWAAVVHDDTSRRVVDRLLELTQRIAAECPRTVRQRCRCEADPDGGEPIQDLDQLMSQARLLDPFLRCKVQDWALASQGSFPVITVVPHYQRGDNKRRGSCLGAAEFHRWEAILQDPQLAAGVRWAPRKTTKRAIEKLFRSYSFDCSRLLDCCRQSIYFDDLENLMSCVAVAAQDPAVRLMRVNNRLHSGYSSGLTAGYRDVMLCLRISTDETRRLGIDGHVCEVQLILIDFAKIKSEDGHARYVMWRNHRGA